MAEMVFAVLVYGTLARDGHALGTGSEIAYLRTDRSDCRCSHVRITGRHRRGAELGLSLHLDSRCSLYDLWTPGVELLRGSRTVHGMAAESHRGRPGIRPVTGDVSGRRFLRFEGVYARPSGWFQRIEAGPHR